MTARTSSVAGARACSASPPRWLRSRQRGRPGPSAGPAARGLPLPPLALPHDRRRPLRRRLGLGVAPLERRLLAVVLIKRAGLGPQLEDRHLPLRPLAEPERHHGRADPRPYIHRAARRLAAARAIEPVHITVPRDPAKGDLMHP